MVDLVPPKLKTLVPTTLAGHAVRIVGWLALPAVLPIAFFAGMFGARSKATPAEFEAMLTTLIECGPDFRSVYEELGLVRMDDARLEALREETFAVGDPPWDDEDIDHLKVVREKVRALIAGTQAA